MDTTCAYCGADVTAHDPVEVADGIGPDRSLVGRFCNYACLAVYIDEGDLTAGAACRIDCC